jgi:superfamily I DNA and/or RNA helicase
MAIDTVDGFRGREKTAVVVSLVRSPPDGEVGFLENPRQFNLALTRARRRAVVVGDADTVTAVPTFEAFSRSPASAVP